MKTSAVRAQRNRSIKSAVKTKITKFRRGVVDGAEGVENLAVVAISALDRAVTKGVLHRNNAARRKARLVKRLQAAAQVVPAPAPPAKSSKQAAPKQPAKSTRSKAASKR
jgi:small subunit ribosomal protein S20